MSLSESSEFIDLCQAQLNLLSQSLGVSLGVVYLTGDWSGHPTTALVPVAAYPDLSALQHPALPPSLDARALPVVTDPGTGSGANPGANPVYDRRRLSPMADITGQPSFSPPSPLPLGTTIPFPLPPFPPTPVTPASSRQSLPQHQVVLPLQQDGFMLGFLVVERQQHPWTDQDYGQLEHIAQTLALACVLERRFQWLQQRYQQQDSFQAQQQDIFDTLLHQIRNPLTALRTFGKLLRRRLPADDHNRGVVDSMLRESDRIQTLLQQLGHQVQQWSQGTPAQLPESMVTPVGESPALPPASLSLLESEELILEPCGLAGVLEPILEAAQVLAEELQIQLVIQIPLQLPPIAGQGDALREVLSNVVDNALKYTPTGGRVAIVVHQGMDPATGEPWQEVVVSDTGPGIPQGDRPQLFQRHYRGVQAEGEIPGTGLGLAIVKELVEQMQGQLDLISPAGDWYPAQQADWGFQHSGSPDWDSGKSGDVQTPPGTAVQIRFPLWASG
ncbi:sensor histidine kinase [Prochlorothrix hollandica]|uniref:sensor histidine kinase n=1 Tax=Prochlorothrix hollandica TaxID=1223 RepID=UPI00034D00E0|nr:HAMP domain-containing sensor histidine kinase [Prochlorothrix hollandica]